MATIKKLDNGKWRVQPCFSVNGKTYRPTFTANTKAECEYWLSIQRVKYKEQNAMPTGTVRNAIEEYIKLGETLSPKSLSTYEKIMEYAFQSIMDMPVIDLTDSIMQQAINEESRRMVTYRKDRKQISPKTVHNEYGLISSAIKQVHGLTFNVRLPKTVKKLRDYPHPSEVIPILKGTDIEVPCLMSMFLSLRMSEVRGAKFSSIRKGYLYVEQVKIYVDGEDIVKANPKTYGSTRKILVPQYLLALIDKLPHDTEYIVNMTENQLSKRFTRLMKASGYEITFHSLRHIFASTGAMLGVQSVYLADIGGWEDLSTLQKTYEEVFGSEKNRSERIIADYFDTISGVRQ